MCSKSKSNVCADGTNGTASYVWPAHAPYLTPPAAPIYVGISLLVAAGIGYGTKKVRDATKKTKSHEEK